MTATNDSTLEAAISPRRPAPDPTTLLRLWQGWEPERPELLAQRLYPKKSVAQKVPA